MTESERFGYVRIGDKPQNFERQKQAIQEYSINERYVFADKQIENR